MSWSFETDINHSLVRPKQEDYTSWNEYQKDVMEYLRLKFKDTYKNGN
jgi:hypothetical protein|tara:strand:+ start:989 stop:1132 length:144 start_codon:yes stop_codon:yes gene_type:complete